MKRKSALVLTVAVLLIAAFALGGCANTLIGEGGPKPAGDMYGVWAPSGQTASDDNTYYLYATGNATLGTKTYTWSVDPEASDPQKIIFVDPNGKKMVKAFDFNKDDQTLTLYDGESSSSGKTVYHRQEKLETPALGTLPPSVPTDN